MRILRAGLPLIAALALCPVPALAQKAGAPPAAPPAAAANETDAMTVKARELYMEGIKLYRAEKWAQAEAAFEAAWALTEKKSKGLVNNLGQTEMHLGKHREAAEHLSVARRLAGKDDKQLPDIERDLATARTKVGAIVVTVNIEGAQLLLGDKPIGTAPLVDPLFVDPGKVTLTAFKDGYTTAKLELDIKAGEELPVTFDLKKPEAAPTATASLTATTPPPPAPRSKVPAFVMGGAAVVAIALGAGLLAASRGQFDTTTKLGDEIRAANGTCKPGAPGFDARCEDAESAANSSNALKGGGIAALAIGGAAAAGAAVWLFWPAPKPSQQAVRVVPVAADGTAGLLVLGRF